MWRVLHLRSSSGFYGPERQILQLVEPMQRDGFHVEILVLYRRRGIQPLIHPLVERAKGNGREAEQLDDHAKFSPKVVLSIAKKLKEREFSLIHTHDYKANLLGFIASRLVKIPPVATVHLHDLSTYPLRLYRLLDLVTLRFFPKVIVVAESLRRELIGAGLPADKIVTIHNAIDAQAFASRADANDHGLRRQLGINDHQPLVSTVGRLSPQKGQRDFLEAARRVLAVFPKTRFLVIGGGPGRAELEVLAASLGIDGAVSFLGYRRDVAAWMAISDVIVMASVREGLPYVLLEALALAKPVVATRVGGVPELIQDGETGLLVPPKHPERLAEAILYVLSHREEATRLGKRGRERVWQEFSPKTMAHKMAEVYGEVLAGGQESQQ